MSDEQQIAIPVNLADDCSAEQPPKGDAEMSDVVLLSEDDDAANLAPPPNDDAILAPMSNDDDGAASLPVEDASPTSPPKENTGPAPPLFYDIAHHQQIAIPANIPDDCSAEQPPKDNDAAACPVQPPKDIALPACQLPLPLDEAVPLASRVEPGFSRANDLENTSRVKVKQEIEHKTVDWGNTYDYDDKKKTMIVSPKVVAPGLVPDRIIGTTEIYGKLHFLILWKNSKEPDLLESNVILDHFPEIACKFLFPYTHEYY